MCMNGSNIKGISLARNSDDLPFNEAEWPAKERKQPAVKRGLFARLFHKSRKYPGTCQVCGAGTKIYVDTTNAQAIAAGWYCFGHLLAALDRKKWLAVPAEGIMNENGIFRKAIMSGMHEVILNTNSSTMFEIPINLGIYTESQWNAACDKAEAKLGEKKVTLLPPGQGSKMFELVGEEDGIHVNLDFVKDWLVIAFATMIPARTPAKLADTNVSLGG